MFVFLCEYFDLFPEGLHCFFDEAKHLLLLHYNCSSAAIIPDESISPPMSVSGMPPIVRMPLCELWRKLLFASLVEYKEEIDQQG